MKKQSSNSSTRPVGGEHIHLSPIMKTYNLSPSLCSQTRALAFIAATLLALTFLAPSAFAASQTWTNAPVSVEWTNINNWVARAVPGDINATAANTVNNDVVTFNSPIAGGIGGAANPIIPDDATINNGRSRRIGSITFDTTNCGAYVIYSPSPAVAQNGASPATGILYVSHNGGIRINDAVTNSQKIAIPMLVNLPSSQNGFYNLVNNSTNPNVTLTINSIQHAGATSRGTTYVLDGTNTANNIVTNMSEGTSAAAAGNAGGITKQGPGTWIVAGTGTFIGNSVININNGILAVQVADAFGAASAANTFVTNLGTLRLDGVTLNQASVGLRKGGTIRANGTAGINGVAVGAQTTTTATLSTTSGSDVFTVSGVVSGGAADTVLSTAGPGILVFGNANTYIGKWSFNAKTNQITNPSALGTGVNANVGAGAILDLTLLGATSFVPTTTGFGGSGTGATVGTTAAAVLADAGGTLDLTGKNVNLTFTPTGFSGDTTHPALSIVQGSLTLSGNTFFINNASGTALGLGTYRLIVQASGSVTSGGGYAVLISGSGMVGGATASIQVTGGNVDLVIAAYVPKNLVWTGGSLNANWNVATDANWLNGATVSVFNTSDNVTFNSIGSTNPTVTLFGTLAPASVVVDTSANDYTFTGAGQIGGTTALIKKSAGVLNLGTVNTYAGGTVISNGTLKVTVNNAIPAIGVGDVAVYGNGVIDLNGFSDGINALNGNGTVDVTGGGTSTLTVGNNDNSGTFAGVINNTAGTLALTKIGNGTETLTASNSYAGGTIVSAGTLAAGNSYALGTNGSVTVNAGTLDLKTNLYVVSLAGGGGSVANNSTATTNTLVIVGNATTTYGGSIVNGSGGGGIAVQVLGGSLRLSAGNTYTGGTIVGSGATFLIGNNAGSGVTGGLIASNNATVGMPGGSNPPGTPTSITTVDGATVTFTSGAEGNIWNSQFIGSAIATNRFIGPVSAGGNSSFQNFNGVVQFAETGGNLNFRFFNGGGISGGTNTTFEFITGNAHTRDAQTVELGAIQGGTSTSGIGGQGAVVANWVIGSKSVNNTFEGYISGSNNLVKVGSASLTLDGMTTTTNTDSVSFTNYLYSPLISYIGTTTVSNGVLALVVPNTLTNNTTITLASSSAVLDASKMGYVSNQLDDTFTVTNQLLITNGVFELYTAQTLAGVGTIWGRLLADSGSFVNPGLPTGTLTVTNGVDLESVTMNINLNRSSSQTSGQLAASGSTPILVNGGTLVVTNQGPDLVTGDVFTLFNKGITGSGFASIVLPAQNLAATITYVYETNLVVAGSSPAGTIKVLSGAAPVNQTPTNITTSVSGNVLTLSWPADHIGWRLQVQTNSLTVGLRSNWVDVAGSTTVNTMPFTLDPANGSVFFRMVYP